MKPQNFLCVLYFSICAVVSVSVGADFPPDDNDPSEDLVVLTRWQRASWQQGEGPDAFDGELDARAYLTDASLLIQQTDSYVHDTRYNAGDRVLNMSADGLMVAVKNADSAIHLLRFGDVESFAKREFVPDFETLHFAVSAAEANVGVFVNIAEPEAIFIVNLETGLAKAVITLDEPVESMALSADGTTLAVATSQYDDDDFLHNATGMRASLELRKIMSGDRLSRIRLIDLETSELRTMFSVKGEVVKLAVGVNLVMELNRIGRCELRNYAIFDKSSLNQQQIYCLEDIGNTIEAYCLPDDRPLVLSLHQWERDTLASLSPQQLQRLCHNISFADNK